MPPRMTAGTMNKKAANIRPSTASTCLFVLLAVLATAGFAAADKNPASQGDGAPREEFGQRLRPRVRVAVRRLGSPAEVASEGHQDPFVRRSLPPPERKRPIARDQLVDEFFVGPDGATSTSNRGSEPPASKTSAARLPIDDLTQEFMRRQLRLNREMRAKQSRVGRDKRPEAAGHGHHHADHGQEHHHHHDAEQSGHSGAPLEGDHHQHHDHARSDDNYGQQQQELVQGDPSDNSYLPPSGEQAFDSVPEVPSSFNSNEVEIPPGIPRIEFSNTFGPPPQEQEQQDPYDEARLDDSVKTSYAVPDTVPLQKYARPSPSPPPTSPAPQDDTTTMMPMDASYSFGYNYPELSRNEAADPSGNVQGNFTYLDENGNELTVVYQAGKGTGVVILRDDRVPPEGAPAGGQQGPAQPTHQQPQRPAKIPQGHIPPRPQPAARPPQQPRPVQQSYQPPPKQQKPIPKPWPAAPANKPHKAVVVPIVPARPVSPLVPKPVPQQVRPYPGPAQVSRPLPRPTLAPHRPPQPAPAAPPKNQYGPPLPAPPKNQYGPPPPPPSPPKNQYGPPPPPPAKPLPVPPKPQQQYGPPRPAPQTGYPSRPPPAQKVPTQPQRPVQQHNPAASQPQKGQVPYPAPQPAANMMMMPMPYKFSYTGPHGVYRMEEADAHGNFMSRYGYNLGPDHTNLQWEQTMGNPGALSGFPRNQQPSAGPSQQPFQHPFQSAARQDSGASLGPHQHQQQPNPAWQPQIQRDEQAQYDGVQLKDDLFAGSFQPAPATISDSGPYIAPEAQRAEDEADVEQRRTFFPIHPSWTQQSADGSPNGQHQQQQQASSTQQRLQVPAMHERAQAFSWSPAPAAPADNSFGTGAGGGPADFRFGTRQDGAAASNSAGGEVPTSYRFSYDAGDHSRTEQLDPNRQVSGSYSFVGDDGVERTVRYTAGAGTGFVAEGDHLPQPPALPDSHLQPHAHGQQQQQQRADEGAFPEAQKRKRSVSAYLPLFSHWSPFGPGGFSYFFQA